MKNESISFADLMFEHLQEIYLAGYLETWRKIISQETTLRKDGDPCDLYRPKSKT